MHDLKNALELSSLVWGNPMGNSSITDTQIAYKDINGERLVCFEATDSWRDLCTHIQFWPKRFHGARVHAGFLKAYLSVRDILWQWIKDSPYPIVWTGHSLGGALAHIAVLELGGRAVTTGSPRVFFGRTPLIDVLRFETQDDPVTYLPPFYHHVGHLSLIHSSKSGWRAHIPDAYMEGLK